MQNLKTKLYKKMPTYHSCLFLGGVEAYLGHEERLVSVFRCSLVVLRFPRRYGFLQLFGVHLL